MAWVWKLWRKKALSFGHGGNLRLGRGEPPEGQSAIQGGKVPFPWRRLELTGEDGSSAPMSRHSPHSMSFCLKASSWMSWFGMDSGVFHFLNQELPCSSLLGLIFKNWTAFILNSHTQDFVMPFSLNHATPPLLRKSVFSDSKGPCLFSGRPSKGFHHHPSKEWQPQGVRGGFLHPFH